MCYIALYKYKRTQWIQPVILFFKCKRYKEHYCLCKKERIDQMSNPVKNKTKPKKI